MGRTITTTSGTGGGRGVGRLLTLGLAIAALLLTVVAAPAAAVDNVPVTLRLSSFDVLDDPDPALGQGAGDFYAEISFADGTSTTTGQVHDNGEFDAPSDWTLTTTVDRDAQATLDATVRIFDSDSGPAGPDDEIDLDPADGELPLDITIDLSDGSWSGDSPDNTGFVEGDGDTGHTGLVEGGEAGRLRFSVALGPSVDVDGDGIPNAVERFGIRNPDGSMHTDMAALGADPCRKTIAIEIDWLSVDGSDALRPKPAAVTEATDMFDDAPIGAITDCPYAGFPTQSSGANMIVDVDSPIPWSADDVDEPFGLGDLDDQRATDFADERDEYFFYSVWGYTHNGSSSSGVCCNEKGFMVTLGRWSDAGSVRQQAGTLVHELGHNLGLGHGGGDGSNYKPNYLSVMNYRYQTIGLVDFDAWLAAGGTSSDYVPNATIDYSRAALPSLDEDDLDEPDGIAGPNTAVYWRDPAGDLQVSDARTANDYDDDGDATDTGLGIDLNEDGLCIKSGDDGTLDSTAADDDVVDGGRIWPGPDATCDTTAAGDDEQVTAAGTSRTDVLDGYDDWDNIAFAGEINAGLGGNTTPLDDVEEITFEQHQQLVADIEEAANEPPVADAGADVDVVEGSTVTLDGSGSSDPDGDTLTHAWSPGDNLDDPTSPTPDYTGVDDGTETLTLTVTDPLGLSDTDTVEVTTTNADPEVDATGDDIDEGGTAAVAASFTDPGLEDDHTAVVDWGDGTSESVPVAQAAGSGSLSATHVYGDDGVFPVAVTVTDDDGGTDTDTVSVTVGNLDPDVSIDDGAAVTFPGGDAVVTALGEATEQTAEAEDPGSDDLTFAWGFGPTTTYFNDGTAPDPPMSPFGTFPFHASDTVTAGADEIGVGAIDLQVSDDDGGGTSDSVVRLVTGVDDRDHGPGFWRTEYRQRDRTAVDADTLEAYLQIVRFVSTVFDEDVALTTVGDGAEVLSPRGNDARARARSDLLVAWLHFASGAVPHDALVPLGPDEVPYLEVMADLEATVGDPGATDAELGDASRTAQQTRHAE